MNRKVVVILVVLSFIFTFLLLSGRVGYSHTPRIIFITFGTSEYANSVNRITGEAKSFGIFDEVYGFTDASLRSMEVYPMMERFLHLRSKSIGYGFWIWKPAVILHALTLIEDGDIVVYADAGCHLNINGLEKLKEVYLRSLTQHDIFAFQMNHLLEYQYTKGCVFDYLGIRENRSITHTGQYVGGIQMIKKTSSSHEFLFRWFELGLTGNLITDSQCDTNFEGFIAHRRDQSLFSCLAKMYPHKSVFEDRSWANNWAEINDEPIQARRWH
jgi:hypothetical protein